MACKGTAEEIKKRAKHEVWGILGKGIRVEETPEPGAAGNGFHSRAEGERQGSCHQNWVDTATKMGRQ